MDCSNQEVLLTIYFLLMSVWNGRLCYTSTICIKDTSFGETKPVYRRVNLIFQLFVLFKREVISEREDIHCSQTDGKHRLFKTATCPLKVYTCILKSLNVHFNNNSKLTCMSNHLSSKFICTPILDWLLVTGLTWFYSPPNVWHSNMVFSQKGTCFLL